MSFMYISEYANAGRGGIIPVGDEPEATTQKITVSGVAAASAAFNPVTTLVRIHVDGITSIKFGTNPTAAITDKRLAVSQTEYFTVPQGQSYKVSAITNT